METLPSLFPPRSWLPNLATAANIAVGFAAIHFAAEGRYEGAVYLLLAGIFLDMADGRLARWLKATSPLGQQLDSFCDLVTFGIAPSFLLFHAELGALGVPGFAVALLYLLAGVFRLARFNLLSNAHSKARRTLGMPIPIGAGYLMVAVLMRESIAPWVTALIVVLVALGMISTWRLPDLKGRGLVSAFLLIGMGNYLLVVFRPNWYTVAWWTLWNLVILAAARKEDRTIGTQQTAEGM